MRVALIHLFLAHLTTSWAQNLVPNGGFEEYTACPTSDDQMNYATGWEAYMYSPDFWHACGIPYQSSVPNNIAGYQPAHSGQGYAGIHAFTAQGQSANGYREVLGVQLIYAMIPGAVYHFQLYLSWTSFLGQAQYANNKIGALFSTQMRSGFDAWYPLPNYAHVYTEEIITDSVGWTLVEGDFIADSAYTYMYLGNFFGDAETDDTLINPGGMFGLSYYYVDDVCVTPVGSECGVVGVLEPVRDQVQLLGPNPCRDELWLRGPVGTVAELSLHALTGQLVFRRLVPLAGSATPLNIAGTPPGTYLASLRSGGREAERMLLMVE